MKISVVVPALEEAPGIAACVRQFSGLHQVLVVDGGSRDATAAAAEEAGARVLRSRACRALQQNIGAASATGDVLWFVHADVRVPAGAANAITLALLDEGVVGGAFRTLTVADRSTRLKSVLGIADLRASYTRHPYGDQGIFVRRADFEAVGGFPIQPLFEDLELCRKLWRRGRMAALPQRVEVSARRFLAAPAWYSLVMNLYPVLYRAGVPAEVLARGYRRER